MSPGPLTTSHRGGFGFNHNRGYASYTGPRFAGYVTPGRHFSGSRERFSVSTNPDTGAHDVALGDNEVAIVTVGDDGQMKIEISNRPPAEEPAPAEGAKSASRSAQVDKMAWERNPADGSVTFMPGEDEVLQIDGDALQALVTALPSP